MSQKKNKVLILGGTGFIGQNLIKHFSKLDDYEVHSTFFHSTPINTPNVNWHKVDLRQNEQVINLISDQDIVIQAAATTSGIAEIVSLVDYHITDNVVMNANILRRVNQVGIKHFIFFSCITMLQSNDNFQTEDDFKLSDEMHPRYFGIGWTKVYIEKLCEYYSRQNTPTKFSVIRHSNVFGPGDKFSLKNSHVFGAVVTKVLTASENVEIWGNGSEKRDLIYIDDLIDFVFKLIYSQKQRYLLLNCGGTAFISISELYKKVINMSGRNNIKIKFNESAPTVNFTARVNTDLAFKEIGWRAQTNFDSAILDTINYWKAKRKLDLNWPN